MSAAPVTRSIGALAALELKLTARRGENILATIIIPVAVLLFFAGTSVIPLGNHPVDFLLPGSIALGLIAAGMVNLGIATGYDRSYGVLKRLGGSPLPRWGLIAAKLIAVGVLEIVQVVALMAVAVLFLGWAPGPAWSPLLFVVALILGTAAFAGLGLLLAGTLRAEATLALANALFLAFLMLGGIILPVDHLPGFLQPIAAFLPATALSELLRYALDSGGTGLVTPAAPLGILAAWAVAAIALTIKTFRWD
ncbi:MAG TPA: ABC transporter permease [Candidatus Limnocylindrales bacterium]|nr:ABC transporter permease [Candidatus Limnocylindrales bacterium]